MILGFSSFDHTRELTDFVLKSLAVISGIAIQRNSDHSQYFLTFCRERKFVKYRSNKVFVVFISWLAFLGPSSFSPFLCNMNVSCLIFFLYLKFILKLPQSMCFKSGFSFKTSRTYNSFLLVASWGKVNQLVTASNS